MKKLWPARGSNWRSLDFLPLSYGALHARENLIVDFEPGVGLKLDNFHSFMNSAIAKLRGKASSSKSKGRQFEPRAGQSFFICEWDIQLILQRLSSSL